MYIKHFVGVNQNYASVFNFKLDQENIVCLPKWCYAHNYGRSTEANYSYCSYMKA